MNRTALVLAAHGCRQEPESNAMVCDYADRMATRRWFDEVIAAFHQGRPGFADVLDLLDADQVTVVPFMTSQGYFSDVVLPRELAKNQRYNRIDMHQTAPVGTHPKLASLLAGRLTALLEKDKLEPAATTLAVVGHGTQNHPESRIATEKMVASLAQRRLVHQVLPAFLDEDPRVETILDRATAPNVVVMPFLIGNGLHATRDLPTRLGFTSVKSQSLPCMETVGQHRVCCDAAIGTDEGMVDIVADLLRPGHHAPSEWNG